MAAGPSGAERDGRPGGTAPVPSPGSPVVPLERRGQGSPQGEAGPGGAVPPQLPATPGPGPAPPRCWWGQAAGGAVPKTTSSHFWEQGGQADRRALPSHAGRIFYFFSRRWGCILFKIFIPHFKWHAFKGGVWRGLCE